MQVSLDQAAAVIGCHQRTILRATTGKPNPYWSESYNPVLEVDDIAEGFGCNAEMLEGVFRGNDKLLTPKEAAKRLKIVERALRYRNLTPMIKHGGVVRYSKVNLDLIEDGLF